MEGSSISTTRGSSIIARAISTSFCSPPESEPARSRRRSRTIGNLDAISSTRRRSAARDSTYPPMSTLSHTLIEGKRLRSCGTWTTP